MALTSPDPPEVCIVRCLEMIETSQSLITAIARAAQAHPQLAQECGEAIRLEKDIIKRYEKELRQCITL